MFDAIVVGARCAGAPTAMLLARKGHRVLLCDRASFPSDTVSNGGFNIPGPIYLERWGLLHRLEAAGTPQINSMIVNFGGQQFKMVYERPVYCPMRLVLDDILVRAAVEAGAELKENFRVTDVVREDGRVVGVRGLSGEREEEILGRIVVGADGRRSTVARRVQAREFDHVPMSGGGVFAYFENVSLEGYEFFYGDVFAMLAPSNHGLTHIATGSADVSGTSQERWDRNLDAWPELAERVRAGKRRTRLVTYRDAPVFFRQAFGAGWALVGDAGFHQGPWNGYGMSHAFRDAERLAIAIDEWLSGLRAFDDALTGYETDRDDWCRPFRENINAILGAIEAGRQPQWGGEWPHVLRWVQSLLPDADVNSLVRPAAAKPQLT